MQGFCLSPDLLKYIWLFANDQVAIAEDKVDAHVHFSEIKDTHVELGLKINMSFNCTVYKSNRFYFIG